MWEPHDPFSFFGHIVFGTVAYVAGLVAIGAIKGSRTHVRAGWTFAIGMGVASITAAVFMVNRFLPLALVMAIATLYLLVTGILAIRHDRAYAPALERSILVVPAVLAVATGLQVLNVLRAGGPSLAGPMLLLLIFVGLFAADLRLAWRRHSVPLKWRQRHLVRMLLAFGFATTAALNINRGALGVPLEYTVVVPMGVALLLAAWFVRRHATRPLVQETA